MSDAGDPGDTAEMLITRLGGRTFVLTLGCGAVTSVLVWFGKIDGGTYAAVILGTVGAYIAANAVQKVKQIAGDTATQIAATEKTP